MVSNTNVVDPRRSRNLAEELSVKCGFGLAKNDHIDVNMLAEQDRMGLTPNIHVPTLEQLEHRALVRHRTDLVVLKTALCNKISGHFALRGIPVGVSRLCNERDYQEKVLSNLKDFTFSPLMILLI
jgi:transposase